jgi:hypothetical protein
MVEGKVVGPVVFKAVVDLANGLGSNPSSFFSSQHSGNNPLPSTYRPSFTDASLTFQDLVVQLLHSSSSQMATNHARVRVFSAPFNSKAMSDNCL